MTPRDLAASFCSEAMETVKKRRRIPRFTATVEKGPLAASVSLDINPMFRHVAEFLSLRCAPDYLAASLLPKDSAAKELTESMAAFSAARRVLGQARLADSSVRVLDVGSGHSPRTAALFAFRSRWSCVAIDPALRADRWEGRIKRCGVVRAMVQDYHFAAPETLVITMVHAHVSVVETLRSVSAPDVLVIAIPCCIDLRLPVAPVAEYEDFGCLSPERTVRVWRLNAEQLASVAGCPRVEL